MRFCPVCGADLHAGLSFVQEFWVADERDFLGWCAACGAMTTVVVAPAVVGHEPEH